jgi:hypothetical protein
VGDILFANTTTSLAKLADVATGNALISGGVGVAPAYGKIGLTTHISGVLPVANGGTNASTASITSFNNITGYTASGATGTTSTNLVFSTSPAITTPSVTGDLTMSTGNVVMSDGKGIDFSATPGTGTSELLDDYEEGTWTPAYSYDTPPTTPFTMAIITAQYTKVGRKVTAKCWIRTDDVNISGASGGLRITGLPFAPDPSGNDQYSAAFTALSSDFAAEFPSAGFINGTNIILLHRPTSAGAATVCTTNCLTTGATANQNSLVIVAEYFTAS